MVPKNFLVEIATDMMFGLERVQAMPSYTQTAHARTTGCALRRARVNQGTIRRNSPTGKTEKGSKVNKSMANSSKELLQKHEHLQAKNKESEKAKMPRAALEQRRRNEPCLDPRMELMRDKLKDVHIGTSQMRPTWEHIHKDDNNSRRAEQRCKCS